MWHTIQFNYMNERNNLDTLALRIRNYVRLSRETMPNCTNNLNQFNKNVFKKHDKITEAPRRNVWRSRYNIDQKYTPRCNSTACLDLIGALEHNFFKRFLLFFF